MFSATVGGLALVAWTGCSGPLAEPPPSFDAPEDAVEALHVALTALSEAPEGAADDAWVSAVGAFEAAEPLLRARWSPERVAAVEYRFARWRAALGQGHLPADAAALRDELDPVLRAALVQEKNP